MDIPDFLRFTPVPVRARRDGWTPALQRGFILLLARGHGTADAARRIGRSRQTAYALRARPGSESFADAWDMALDFARTARAAAGPALLLRDGEDSMLVPRFYRGRLVGFVQREDHRAALRTLRHLDRLRTRKLTKLTRIACERMRVVTFKDRHCERSEAIQLRPAWIASSLAPRNDGDQHQTVSALLECR
ncbi:MAG: hypothetical protein M3Q15_02170 [Pseudomonadota bacterium]|nr:hypothetical protein [Pseudomonadota bacterium]